MHGVVNIEEILIISQSNILRDDADRNRRMIGILFLKPHSNLVSDEIIKNGEFFHVRSGKNIDFFLPGYGGKDPNKAEQIYDINIGDTGFVFNCFEFVECIKEFHEKTSWRYSGETDLLLLDILMGKHDNKPDFDFNNVICCNLDALIKSKSITSIHRFFEIIVQFIEFERHEKPTITFSDLMGLKKGKDGIINFVKNALPKDTGEDLEKIIKFRTQSIQQKNPS